MGGVCLWEQALVPSVESAVAVVLPGEVESAALKEVLVRPVALVGPLRTGVDTNS